MSCWLHKSLSSLSVSFLMKFGWIGAHTVTVLFSIRKLLASPRHGKGGAPLPAIRWMTTEPLKKTTRDFRDWVLPQHHKSRISNREVPSRRPRGHEIQWNHQSGIMINRKRHLNFWTGGLFILARTPCFVVCGAKCSPLTLLSTILIILMRYYIFSKGNYVAKIWIEHR